MTTALDKFEKERQAHKKPVKMTIESKVPSKWRFVDLETGSIFRWDEKAGTFKDANDSPFNGPFETSSFHMLAGLRDDIVDEVAKNHGWSTERILSVRKNKDSFSIESDEDPKAKHGMWLDIGKSRLGKLVPKKGDTITFFGRGLGQRVQGVAINGKRLY